MRKMTTKAHRKGTEEYLVLISNQLLPFKTYNIMDVSEWNAGSFMYNPWRRYLHYMSDVCSPIVNPLQEMAIVKVSPRCLWKSITKQDSER